MHDSIKTVLKPLRPYMSRPDIVMCPDGHHRKAVYVLGPYIADYPEQVILAGVVSGWCAGCVYFSFMTSIISSASFQLHLTSWSS
jgi:hypothetical protein